MARLLNKPIGTEDSLSVFANSVSNDDLVCKDHAGGPLTDCTATKVA